MERKENHKIHDFLERKFGQIDGLEDFFQEILEQVLVLEKQYEKTISDYGWDETNRDLIRRGSDII